MAFPWSDRQYALIMDAVTGTEDMFASRQLKDHEKNYSPFLLEAAAAIWGMDNFNEYLKGKCFILYTCHKPLEKL
jgi:RNase H-like domain found in reverse transcriptase